MRTLCEPMIDFTVLRFTFGCLTAHWCLSPFGTEVYTQYLIDFREIQYEAILASFSESPQQYPEVKYAKLGRRKNSKHLEHVFSEFCVTPVMNPWNVSSFLGYLFVKCNIICANSHRIQVCHDSFFIHATALSFSLAVRGNFLGKGSSSAPSLHSVE
jgi:hypothetical protein